MIEAWHCREPFGEVMVALGLVEVVGDHRNNRLAHSPARTPLVPLALPTPGRSPAKHYAKQAEIDSSNEVSLQY
jgi:hypothetical protein